MSQFYLLEFTEPKPIQAGSVGADKKPFYFDCAQCDAKAPAIKGVLCSTPEFQWEKIAIIGKNFPYRLALFCAPCFEKRMAESIPPTAQAA